MAAAKANALIVASFNGTTLSTTADVNGSGSLALPATVYNGLGNGSYPLTVTASDAAGNATTTSRDLALKVEPGTLPTLTLDTVLLVTTWLMARNASPISVSRAPPPMLKRASWSL